MNDLYFFWKMPQNKLCGQALTPGQGIFPLQSRQKRLFFQRLQERFLCAFLPKKACFRAQPDGIGQLHRTAALLHERAQQPDVLFLRVPHRRDQRVQRRFQDQRVCRRKRRQPPDRLPCTESIPRTGRQLRHRLCELCRRQKFPRLCRKIGIRTGCLFTKPYQIFHRCTVGTLQRRERGTAQPVAGVGIGHIRLVRDPWLPRRPAEVLCLVAAQTEQRAQILPALGADARCAVQPGAPRKAEQQCFRLIVFSMGSCKCVYPLLQKPVKAGIAQPPCPVLPCTGRHRAHERLHLPGMKDPQRELPRGAHPADKVLVPVGRRTAQAVVDMADRKLVAIFRLQCAQNEQQRHAVCPAGDRRCQPQGRPGHEQPLLAAERPDPGKCFFGVHQRLKSTSIKRVWAPSQPSGTVLVSP